MHTINLTTPLTVAGRPMSSISLRPLGRRAVEHLITRRVAGGFTVADVTKFAARLSGHSEATIRRLSAEDFGAVRLAFLDIFAAGHRRAFANGAVEGRALLSKEDRSAL